MLSLGRHRGASGGCHAAVRFTTSGSVRVLLVGDCSAGDANGDSQITVDEIIRAVNNALGSCPGR